MISGIESAKLKLVRATEHIEAIKNILATYSISDSNRVTTESNGEEHINVILKPPADISIMSGEVIYQIRSALDHLAFDLVKRNPQNIVLPKTWTSRSKLPLLTVVPMRGNPPVPCDVPLPYGFFASDLPGITEGAHAFIEMLQPYNTRGPWFLGTFNAMGVVERLSKIDKHRHLNITVGRVRQNEIVTFDSGRTHGTWTILDDKTKLQNVVGTEYPMGRAVDVERTFATIVTFDEGTLPDASKIPVSVVLDFCAYVVETFVIPGFEKLVQ